MSDATHAFSAAAEVTLDEPGFTPRHGVRAVIESDVISHERLPMLDVVYDRTVRAFATSMRGLTSDVIDVQLASTSSVRFGDFTGKLAQPSMIGVFRVEEWENYGLVTVEAGLIYAVVDALLGGRRGGAGGVPQRGFTSIEAGLVGRMLKLVLADLSAAFAPITAATAKLERVETSPRFAAIAGPTNICALATFRVDMEGRGGCFSLLLPYATIEPARDKLAQGFMGEKLGRDAIWEQHMESAIRRTDVCVDVVLGERMLSLREVRAFQVGQTVALPGGPDDALAVHCGGVPLARAHIGQRCNNIAVRLVSDVGEIWG